MSRVAGLVVRVFAGLLLAGLVAPFAIWLPEAWQTPVLLFLLAGGCVALIVVIGRRSRQS